MINTSQLRAKFIEVRNRSISLCEPLAAEDHVVQPVMDVSPPKWHLGHTTWFYENVILKPYLKDFQVYNENYNYVFNSYYESFGKRVLRTDRGNLSRPTVNEVRKYRKYIDESMLQFFEQHKEIDSSLAYLIETGLNHEQQHQELLVYDIKYILGHNPMFPAYQEEKQAPDVESKMPAHYQEVDGGVYEIGYQGDKFYYDNEKGVHKVYLHPFKYLNRLVTNQEYQEFIHDNGYQRFDLWLSEGWEWVKQNQITSPLYWHHIDGKWMNYKLSGLEEVQANEPVTHINYFEANAFASWKKQRLLTEFEWEVAARIQAPIAEDGNFIESGYNHPVPAKTEWNQMLGDGWEWTQSAYLPYPFFERLDGALGEYNGKFMVNQMVLRGGSCATPQNHIRLSYRNFFHPHLRWHFTGIRLAESL